MDAFVLYRNYYEMINQMPTAEDQAAAYKALCGYMLDGIEPELDGMPALFFSYVKPSLDKNIQRAMNGRKGGRPKTKQTESKNKPDNNQNEPIKNQTETKTKPNHNQKQTKTKPNETEIKPTENQTETEIKPNKIINNKIINNKVINNKVINNDNEQSEDGTSACSPKRQQTVTFGYDHDSKIHGITAELLEYWKAQFPAVDIAQEIRSAEAWLDSNRTKRKHDIKRFLVSWLTRRQETLSRTVTEQPRQPVKRNYTGFDGNTPPPVSDEERLAYNGF